MGWLLDEEKTVCSFDGFGLDVLSDARDDVLSSGVRSTRASVEV
jgi:hypothetical protein